MSKTCERCNGTGKIKQIQWVDGLIGKRRKEIVLSCPSCNGSGVIIPKPRKIATVKIYSNTGKFISEWNNVFHADVKERGVVNLTLTDMTTVALIGGVVIVEEAYKDDV